jgi:hypothetical protein
VIEAEEIVSWDDWRGVEDESNISENGAEEGVSGERRTVVEGKKKAMKNGDVASFFLSLSGRVANSNSQMVLSFCTEIFSPPGGGRNSRRSQVLLDARLRLEGLVDQAENTLEGAARPGHHSY